MRQESEIIPYHVSGPPGERVIVIAPHPDDETLGCGGTIKLLSEAGKKVKVVFLTSGDKAAGPDLPSSAKMTGKRWRTLLGKALRESGKISAGKHVTEYALSREEEAEEALKVLGVRDYEFLRFPDRELHEVYEDVLSVLLKKAREFMPDTVYTPSPVEVNPDHRTAADLGLDMQRKVLEGGKNSAAVVAFYEVTVPLRPNVLVDVTSVYGKKEEAVRKYRSQLVLMDYLRHVAAMNTIRALTAGGPRYVEAFWVVDRTPSKEEIIYWMSYTARMGERR